MVIGLQNMFENPSDRHTVYSLKRALKLFYCPLIIAIQHYYLNAAVLLAGGDREWFSGSLWSTLSCSIHLYLSIIPSLLSSLWVMSPNQLEVVTVLWFEFPNMRQHVTVSVLISHAITSTMQDVYLILKIWFGWMLLLFSVSIEGTVHPKIILFKII